MPKLIDLSHPLEHGQLNFPWDPKISVLVHNTVASIGFPLNIKGRDGSPIRAVAVLD